MQICSKLKSFKDNMVFTDVVLLLAFVVVGGFNEYASCVMSVAFGVYLVLKAVKEKQFCLKFNLISVSIAVLVLFYGVTSFWAIDSGMAFIGFLKYLPLILYALTLWQEEKKEYALRVLPYFGAASAVICGLLSLIPFVSDLFLVSGRLSGFFQYPNTFAMFLLICELLLMSKTPLKLLDYITFGVLIVGLLFTGSRTVFLLFIASNFAMLLTVSSKKIRIPVLAVAIVGIGIVLIIALFGPEGNVFSRYLKFGLTESTFVGRLLYFSDALPLLLKYPFGLGYMGYHFLQGSIQTGVYNVAFVHNDFLQIALDIGIIPALLFVSGIVAFFFKKQVSLQRKLIVLTLCMHSMFDFNLQFTAMFMLLILLTDTESGKQIVLKNVTALKIVLPVVILLNLYMGISLSLAHFGAREAADALFPYNTRNTLNILNDEENIDIANGLAEKVLEQNTSYYAPYSIKAKYSYANGDFVGVIENKNAVFRRMPFRYTEYKEYCVMLINGITAYENMGDMGSAKICKNELLSVKNKIESNADRLSKFGKMIDEQPVTTLPSDVLAYIENLNEGQVDED